MGDRLDEIDKRILYHLTQDARNITATVIAEEVSVSPGTVRNRIEQLEDRGIIQGYHAYINYGHAERRLTNLYICTCDASTRERLAKQVDQIPSVIHVREAGEGGEYLLRTDRENEQVQWLEERDTEIVCHEQVDERPESEDVQRPRDGVREPRHPAREEGL